MSRPHWLLLGYRAFGHAFGPFAPAFLARRRRAGKEDAARIGERLGRPGLPRPAGPLVWMHGASVGEGLALLPLVPPLVERGLHVLVTTGTVTSAQVVGDRLPPGALHQYLPLDVPRFAARFLAHWRPGLALLAESELWPNLLAQAQGRGVPVVMVNARLSERSARRWSRLPQVIGDLLGQVDLCLAQSEADADRFAALGAPDVRVTGNLKYDAPPPAAPHEELATLSARIGARPVWVAASTHTGEEDWVADVHCAVARRFPTLLTVLAPRHPRRGPQIAATLRARGLAVAIRSEGTHPGPAAQVYLADTIGDLGLLYRLGGVVFMGKSLGGGGGQNPLEAAKLGCAVLHGPLVANFQEVYRTLDEAGGAIEVQDANDLARALQALLADATRLRAMARAAGETVERLSGATARTLDAIEPYLAHALAGGG